MYEVTRTSFSYGYNSVATRSLATLLHTYSHWTSTYMIIWCTIWIEIGVLKTESIIQHRNPLGTIPNCIANRRKTLAQCHHFGHFGLFGSDKYDIISEIFCYHWKLNSWINIFHFHNRPWTREREICDIIGRWYIKFNANLCQLIDFYLSVCLKEKFILLVYNSSQSIFAIWISVCQNQFDEFWANERERTTHITIYTNIQPLSMPPTFLNRKSEPRIFGCHIAALGEARREMFSLSTSHITTPPFAHFYRFVFLKSKIDLCSVCCCLCLFRNLSTMNVNYIHKHCPTHVMGMPVYTLDMCLFEKWTGILSASRTKSNIYDCFHNWLS